MVSKKQEELLAFQECCKTMDIKKVDKKIDVVCLVEERITDLEESIFKANPGRRECQLRQLLDFNRRILQGLLK